MVSKSSAVIICAKHAWSARYIEELGYTVLEPYLLNRFPLRLIRELWFRLKLPFMYLLYNKVTISQNKTIIVYESLITENFMRWLHKKSSNCRVILLYTNKVGKHIKPDQIEDEWCEKWTCDKDDAKRFGMNLLQGGGYFPQWIVKKEQPIYDVFYIGKDKGRLEKLQAIEKVMNELGIRTMFYITWERGWQKRKDGIHKPFISYEKVLDYIGKSKAILHLKDGAQKGITIRIQESLLHKVKLITDDEDIINYDFYNKNNIFIIGKDDLKDLRSFLDSPYEDVKSDFFAHAFFDQMIDEIIGNSMHKLPM